VSTPGEILNALGREARARLAGGRDGATPRVFRGRTIEELIPRIERDLGADAIVVRRREGLTGGMLGFFQHPWVEIEAIPGTAAVDLYDDLDSVAPPVPAAPVPSGAEAYRAAAEQLPAQPPPPAAAGFVADPMPAPVAPPVAPAAASFAPPAFLPPAVPAPPPAVPAAEPGASPYLTGHLAAVARAEPSMPAPLRPVPPPPDPFVAGPPRPAFGGLTAEPLDFHDLIPVQSQRPTAPADWATRAAVERRTVGPGSQARARAGVEKGLARYGVGETFTAELIDAALAHALPLAPRSGLAAAVRSTLAQRIPVAAPLPAAGASIVLVGAGGSGKTTCCAALLGAYRTGSTLAAAFATIAAEGQTGELRLLMSPQLLRPVAIDSPRALRALRRARAGGLTVLDTPRLSPSDRKGIRRLGRLLGQLEPDRILLALPATLGAAAAAQLLEAFAPLRAHSLVVTHAEETDQIGVAVEAACRFELAPEFMLSHASTGGWRLRRLEPAALAGMVLP
jgi:flagellar biosynthesis GTPase FlhF